MVAHGPYSRLRWYGARVAAMPAREMMHRARSGVLIARERRGRLPVRTAPPGREGWPRARGATVLVTDEDVQAVRAIPGAVDAARRCGERILSGRFAFFGRPEVRLPDEVDWHHDPVSGHGWPRVHWSRIDYRAGGADPKWIWELGRHQHVTHLARAFRLTGEERFARAACRHLDGFVTQNPPGRGIHWRVGLEVGMRLVSWAWTVEFLRGSVSCSAALHGRLLGSVAAHLDYLERYPSLFSSANNHRIGELAGRTVAGWAFPEVPGALEGAEAALTELEAELARQVHPDGVNAEQALAYEGFALDLCLPVVACVVRSRAVPKGLGRPLAGMADHLACVASDSLTLPRVGDDDDAVGIDLGVEPSPPARLRSRLRATAALLGADLPRVEPGADEQTTWLCGARRAGRPRTAAARMPASSVFPRGGHAVLRHRDDRGREVRALLRAGPFGLGPLFAHAHADLLSVCLSVWGEEVLVDPGTFTYYGDARWRDYARSTAAHSTIRIDGREQARPAGPFMWRSPPRAHLDDVSFGGARVVAEGHHTAYAPVRHSRRVAIEDGAVVVTDRLVGPPETRQVELRWHLGAGEVLPAGEGAWSWTGARASVLVRLEGLGPGRVVEGCRSRPLGFVSERLEHWSPAPALVASAALPLPASVTTVVTPRERP